LKRESLQTLPPFFLLIISFFSEYGGTELCLKKKLMRWVFREKKLKMETSVICQIGDHIFLRYRRKEKQGEKKKKGTGLLHAMKFNKTRIPNLISPV
jgi:hypothetical protein